MTKNGSISSSQLFILLFVIKISEVIMIPDAFSDSGYVSVLFTGIIIIFLLSFLSVLLSDYYRKNDFPTLFRAIDFIWIAYFIYLSVYHLYSFNGFISGLTGNTIPSIVILFLLFISSVYSAIKGIEAIARFSAIVFISIIVASILYFIFLYPSFRANNISSFLSDTEFFGKLSISPAIYAWEELTIMFLICRNTKGEFLRCAVIWNSLQTVFLIAFTILISSSLGEYLINIDYPFFHASDGVGGLQRFRPFFVSVSVASLFCTLSTELNIIRQFTEELLPKKLSIKKTEIIIFSAVFGIYLILSSKADAFEIIYNIGIMAAVSVIAAVVLPIFAVFCSRVKITRAVRTAGIICLIFSSLLLFSGCNANQLNQRIIVQGIGIDKNQDNCLVTLIALDTDTQQAENSVKLIYSKGNTVEDAMLSVEKRQGRKLLLSQCLFLMLNKNAAEDSDNTLSYFIKNNDIMKTTNIMVSDEPEVLLTNAITKLDYTSENINVLSDSNTINQSAAYFSLFDYVNGKNSNEREMLIPFIIEDESIKCLRTNGYYKAPF